MLRMRKKKAAITAMKVYSNLEKAKVVVIVYWHHCRYGYELAHLHLLLVPVPEPIGLDEVVGIPYVILKPL